jgi:hypothetical protein
MYIAGCDQPLMPICNWRVGTIASCHFDRIGLSLISAFEAPDVEPNACSRRAPECHRRAGFGFHLTAFYHNLYGAIILFAGCNATQ